MEEWIRISDSRKWMLRTSSQLTLWFISSRLSPLYLTPMLGMGSLNVYTRDQSNQMMMLEWSEHGNHGDRWVEGQVSLSSQNSFNIIMEATFGGNYTGDMALDDTFITQTGLCNGEFVGWFHLSFHVFCIEGSYFKIQNSVKLSIYYYFQFKITEK